MVGGLHDSFCPSLFFGSSPGAGLNAEMPVKTRLIVSGVLGFFLVEVQKLFILSIIRSHLFSFYSGFSRLLSIEHHS